MASGGRATQVPLQRLIALHQDTGDYVAERELVLVNQMVGEFNSGRLTWDRALSYVARIAELRYLESNVETRVKKEMGRDGQAAP